MKKDEKISRAIHQEDAAAIQKLGFFEDELVVLEQRLQELHRRNTSPELRKDVADWLKKLGKKRKELNDLRNGFHSEEVVLAHKVKSAAGGFESVLQRSKELHERMGYYQKEHKETWTAVNGFLSRWM